MGAGGSESIGLLIAVCYAARTDDTIIAYTGIARGSGTLVLRRSVKYHGGV